MDNTHLLYQGISSAGQALVQGAQQYTQNREQSAALDGQLDRVGTMLASFAQQHPDLVNEQDSALIGQIAKAPGQGLAQKKTALADALLWLETKQQQSKDAMVGQYYQAQADNMRSAQGARDAQQQAAADQARRLAQWDQWMQQNPEASPQQQRQQMGRLGMALEDRKAILSMQPQESAGWNLKPGEVVEFEHGVRGYATSQGSVQLKDEETGADVVPEPVTTPDGQVLGYQLRDQKTGRSVRWITPPREGSLQDRVIGMMLANRLGIDLSQIGVGTSAPAPAPAPDAGAGAAATPTLRYNVSTGKFEPITPAHGPGLIDSTQGRF